MARRSVCVEFLGLPGSGKSVLSRRVAELLTSRGIRVEEASYHLAHRGSRSSKLLRKSGRVLAECLRHPVDSLAAVRIIGSVSHPSAKVRLKMTYNWLLVSFLSRRAASQPGVHLMDQGLLQALWSIGFGSGADAIERVGESLCSRVPPADLVAVVEAADDTVRQRLADRPEMDSRMDRIPGVESSLMERCGDLLEIARRIARRGAGGADRVVVVRNETTEDLGLGAERIAGLVGAMLGSAAAGSGG